MKQAGKVIIIGAGHVGSHAAYALASQGLAGEIVLIDIDREKQRHRRWISGMRRLICLIR